MIKKERFSILKIKKKEEDLRSKIKELIDYIDFLTKLCSKYNDLSVNFLEEKGNRCEKNIFNLFRCYVNHKRDFSQNIINMCLDIYKEYLSQ